MSRLRSSVSAVWVCALAASAAQAADVFNLPSGQTSLSLVPVGNAGNPGDPLTGYGAVGYNFSIGKHEITIGQYAQFLNAVAASDTFSLYSPNMASDVRIAGIVRSGSPGNFTYSTIGSPNRPIAYVSWGSMARFANWLSNGQPTGPQGVATTEDGSYALNGASTSAALMSIDRKPNAVYVIPSLDEWYKAAYYDPTPGAGSGDSYWRYATQSDAIPYSSIPPGTASPDATKAANFFRDDGQLNGYNDGYALTSSIVFPTSVNCLTDVGAYNQALSYYGTLDQNGNLAEYTEFRTSVNSRGWYGGAWTSDSPGLLAGTWGAGDPSVGGAPFGFRIAVVPEPSSVLLLVIGCCVLCKRRL